MKRERIIAEVELPEPREIRAGFIPNDDFDDGADTRLWQIWMRSSDLEDERRATEKDLHQSGWVRRRSERRRNKKRST